MRRSSKLTKKQKRAGKRKLLIPSNEIQELMQPITFDDFEAPVKKAVPPANKVLICLSRPGQHTRM